MSAVLSTKLNEIAGYFKDRRPTPITINEQSRQFFFEQISILRDLALCMESELNTFRLLEADRAGRRFLDQEADAALHAAPIAQDGNVFRPDFGGRKS
ncbi:hypothetical protein ASD64_07255 [Mesorhizobium sp. Root157]|uniref:hypothetical protein n=1 Tax=Mesorhizobium sp. Root157 TaxID=1736477 RepID=UPI0006F4D5C6|nr:hypothetical protein [Mesorhizobium sp. Root157]KQZ87228.1 hypothetical protein ASD64_07255 [Mesorhizobium sp. Root157]